jgi:hypothetical protein
MKRRTFMTAFGAFAAAPVSPSAQHTNRMLTVFESRAFAAAGGLVSYGTDSAHSSPKAAAYVDQIIE